MARSALYTRHICCLFLRSLNGVNQQLRWGTGQGFGTFLLWHKTPMGIAAQSRGRDGGRRSGQGEQLPDALVLRGICGCTKWI